jgi:hypothetical protein
MRSLLSGIVMHEYVNVLAGNVMPASWLQLFVLGLYVAQAWSRFHETVSAEIY